MDGRRWATYGRRDDPSPERSHQVKSKGAPSSMRTHRNLALTALLALVTAACSTSSSPAPSTRVGPRPPHGAQTTGASASAAASQAAASPTPLAADPAEAVIPNVEANAQITFWTFYLSPTFDQYIKDTIARFQATYPGVTVKWEDHQGTFKDDLNNAFAANIAPDVINLSVSEGWVSEYAGKGLLLGLNRVVPEGRPGHLLPGSLERAAGQRRELPVPVVPGPQRRAGQSPDLRQDRAHPRPVPQDHRRPAGPVQDDPRQDLDGLRHPPDRQRPAGPDGL